MTINNFDLIFEQWKADLKNRDRSAAAVYGNFEALFTSLRAAGATFDEAHKYLPNATKAHQPDPALARNTYKCLKTSPKLAGFSEKEFVDKWNKDIADKATNAFYDTFPRPKSKDEEDDERKVGGNKITAKEYRLMRNHIDQFKHVDLDSLPDPNQDIDSFSEEELLKLIRGNNE